MCKNCILLLLSVVEVWPLINQSLSPIIQSPPLPREQEKCTPTKYQKEFLLGRAKDTMLVDALCVVKPGSGLNGTAVLILIVTGVYDIPKFSRIAAYHRHM